MALSKAKASVLAICVYVVFCWTGAGIMMSLEHAGLKEQRRSQQQLNVTAQLHKLLKTNFSIDLHASSIDLILKEMRSYMKANDRQAYQSWKNEISFETARKWHYFVAITITTVGYGDIYPETIGGKIFAIFLSFIGIPICTYMIATLGNLFCMTFTTVKFWLKKDILKQDVEKQVTIYCILQCTMITLSFVVISGILMASDEGWNYFDGVYFSFVTFTTIGYGDLTPTAASNWYSELLGGVNVIGLVLMAMTINATVNFVELKQSSTNSTSNGKTTKHCSPERVITTTTTM